MIQPDGKIVAAGTIRDVTGEPNSNIDIIDTNFALARYDADGSLDETFDGDGMLNTKISPDRDTINDMVLQPNGKIVVVGATDSYPQGSNRPAFDFALARYTTDGALDSNFGGDGTFTTSFSPSYDSASSLALRPDGKIVTAGTANGRFLTRHYGGEDATATGPVTGLAANVNTREIALSWTNPTDEDYGATRVVRSNSDYATSADQTEFQTRVYDGTASAVTEADLADGTYYYTVFARDDKGNWSEATKISAVVDTVPKVPRLPIATIDSGPKDYSWSSSPSARFEFSSDMAGSTFQCSLDDGPFEDCSSPKEYTGLSDSVRPDGSAGIIPPHTFRVRAVIDGNIGPDYNARRWYVDTTPPTVEIDYGPHGAVNSGYYNKTEAGFLWNVRDAIPTRHECSLDGAPFGTCPGNDLYQSFYRNLPDGERTFRVRSIDRVENVGEDNITWVVDTQEPATSIDSGPSGTVSAGTARFGLSSAGGGSPVDFRCRLDGAAFAPCGPSQEYTDLANGDHTFSLQATDRAGNVGPVQSRSWTVAPDRANEEVEAGGTLTTDADGEAGATTFDPLETTIESPVAGTVSVVETAATGQAPVGYSFLGQQADITAPASTPENPLRFAFRLDPSLLPAGADHNSIEVFRNGARVEACADQSGTASPNPCVLGREMLADGDIEVTILTAAASYWNLGVVDTVAPRVKDVTPADKVTYASARTNVTATFSEAMKASTINADSFVLVKRGTTTSIGAKVTYAATAKKATLNPKRDLKPGAAYTATIKRGATGATDVTGNALADDKAWTFTVKKR